MKAKNIILLILRLLLGAFFITTAILKLLSIDEFEIYIYSFNLFGFVFSTVIARLVIMAEILFGICLMAKLLYKYAWWLTQAMLVGFTLLLIYIAIFRNDTNCHCMGDLVELNPALSIIKNIVTMALLLLVRKEDDYQFKGKKWAIVGAFLVSFATPFCVVPMDSVYNKFVSPDENVNLKKLTEIQTNSISTFRFSEGNYIVGVYASGCKYCKMSAKKVHQIMEHNAIDNSKFQILIWGDTMHIQQFMDETECNAYQWHSIDPFSAINLVEGHFPTFIMMTDEKIIKSFDMRGINESEFVEFLK